MGYFDSKQRKDITKKGGVEEFHNRDFKPEEVAQALDMVQKIATKQADGFFFTLVKEGKHNEGIAKLYKVDKLQALEAVVRGLQIPPKVLIAFALTLDD